MPTADDFLNQYAPSNQSADAFLNQYQPEPNTAADVAKSIVGSGLPRGLASIPLWAADLGNLVARGEGAAANKILPAVGINLTPEQQANVANPKPFYGSDDAVKDAESATGVHLYQPKTTAGQYANTATQFLVGGKAAGLSTPRAIVSGLASEAAGQATKDTPYETLARLVGGVFGGNLPEAGQSASGAVQQAARRLAAVNPEKYATFSEAGVTPTLADVSDSGVVKAAQNIAGETPFSAGIIDKAKQATQNDAQNVLNQAGMSKAVSAQQAGQTVKEGLQDFLSQGKKDISTLYNKLDSLVPSDEVVSAKPLGDAIGGVLNDVNITPGLAETFGKSDAGKLINTMLGDVQQMGGQLPYEAIKKYRTLVGQRLADGQFLKNEDEAALSRLYGGLSDTMQQAASSKGNDALQAFTDANAANAAFMQKAKNQIEPLLRRDDVQEMFNQVLTQQKIGDKAKAVMDALSPDQQNIVRGSLLKQMGDNNANEFSATTAATRFKGLEPEAQQALMSGMNPAEQFQFRKAMDALMLAKQTAAKGNASRSAYTGMLAGIPVGLISAPTTTLSALATANIGARLMTNPSFIKWLAQVPQNNPAAWTKHLGQLSAIAAANAGTQDDINNFRNSLTQQPSQVPVQPPASAQTPQQPAQQSALVGKIVQAESAGDPNAKNPNSSASGLLQFTNGTWAQMVGKYGKQTGITLADKNNPAAQTVMGQLLAQDNAKYLASKTGRPPTDGEIYAAHVLGPADAVKLINAQGSGRQAITLFPRSVTGANRPIFFNGKTPRSVEEVYSILSQKVS